MTHTLILIGYQRFTGVPREAVRSVDGSTAELAMGFAMDNPHLFGFEVITRAWPFRGLVSATGESASDPRAA